MTLSDQSITVTFAPGEAVNLAAAMKIATWALRPEDPIAALLCLGEEKVRAAAHEAGIDADAAHELALPFVLEHFADE